MITFRCRAFGHKFRVDPFEPQVALTINPPISFYSEVCGRCGEKRRIREQRGVKNIVT